MKPLQTYWPLILIIGFVWSGASYLSWLTGSCEEHLISNTTSYFVGSQRWMTNFMGLFFVVFSFFKLLDLKAFAHAYRSYDIPTKLCPTWGYIYPFVELVIGLMYLHRFELTIANILTILVLGVSIIGVIQSVMNKQKIKCACLGTGFNLPMSQVTIIEDGAMILMAVIMLLF